MERPPLLAVIIGTGFGSGFHIWELPSKKGCRARGIPFVYLQINRRRCPA